MCSKARDGGATSPWPAWSWAEWAAAGVVVVSGLLGLGFLDHTHLWGGDFAQYLVQTRAILEGRQAAVAADLRFIIEGSGPVIGPRWYPPGFPLLLLPVYALAGPDLWLLKLPGWLCWMATLGVMYQWMRDLHYGAWWSVAGLMLLGWNSLLLEFLNYILSDIPFLFLTTLSLWRIGRLAIHPSGAGAYVLTGVILGLACWMRTAGLVLWGVWLLHLLLHPGPRLRWLTWLVASAMLGLQRLASPDGGTAYFAYLGDITLNSLFAQLLRYAEIPALFMGWPLAGLAYALGGLIAGRGIWKLHRQWPVLSWFGAAYALMLLLWPFFDGVRFVFPLVPLLLIWGLAGWRDWGHKWSPWSWVPVGLVAILLLGKSGYGLWERHQSPPEGRVGQEEAEALFAYIRDHTPPETLMYGSAPRVVYFFTGRRGLHLPPPPVAPAEARYIAFPSDPAPAGWQQEYDQGGFRLYQPPEAGPLPEIHP